jgi:hypothetical protein
VNDTEQQLLAELIVELDAYQHDPLGFASNMFPWGEGELEGQSLDDWQVAFLDDLGKKLRAGVDNEGRYIGEAIQKAIASGHGIGKSCLVAILILWAISTLEDTRGVVTANTAVQLQTKTWPELGKWHRLFLGSKLFVFTATAIYSADPAHEKTWRIDAIPWSDTRTEAFAGLHNKGKRILVIFDEASAISDKISEVTEGALTDSNTEIIWLQFGNPTRNTGRFYDCFHKLRHRWDTQQIDSRKVRITNKSKIAKWIEDYGEDSDFARVRVRGVFPRQGDRQFFNADVLEAARKRGLTMTRASQSHMPTVISLDSAWTGVDEIVCGIKRGLCLSIGWVQAKNDDDVALANRLAQTEDSEDVKADACFIDFGYGTGVYSVGKAMNRRWQLVAFGGAATDIKKWKNKRAEMYDKLRTYLKDGGALPDDPKLLDELAALEEIYRDDGIIQLESKEDFKERTGYSPGRSDACALCFAAPVKMKSEAERMGVVKRKFEVARPEEYDPFKDLER